MKTLTNALVGSVVVGTMALASASPAMAQEYGRHYNYGYGYNRGGDSRGAVQQCVSAVERGAGRYSYGGNAQVTDIRGVDAKRYGFKVKGRVVVNTAGRNWRGGNRYYGNGWNQRDRGYDTGTFSCEVRYGQVVDLDFNGIRGLR